MEGAMATSLQQSKANPYIWDSATSVPPETLAIWKDVGNKIDENQTVVWEAAVRSLESALQFFVKCQSSREFVEAYAGQIIAILSEQTPSKIGNGEKTCVNTSLATGIALVVKDLEVQSMRNGESKLIDGILGHAFSKKKNYYKGTKNVAVYHHAGASGHPEVRLDLIDKFQSQDGFKLLNRYLEIRVDAPDSVDGKFTSLETMQHILLSLFDCICQPQESEDKEADAVLITRTLMRYLSTRTDEGLKKIATDTLTNTIKILQKIYDRLGARRRSVMLEFYDFWRSLCLSLIKSTSLPLKLAGWEHIADLIRAVADHRPPPKSFVVTEAGSTFVNGEFFFAGQMTPEGYAKPGQEIKYIRTVGDEEPEGRGKKLTLFRCTMRSQQKWWFISEADEDQPGTDRDIDYYQHKSKEHEEGFPPPAGWTTCRSGTQPPPKLQPHNVLVPAGEERNTLEHKLAQWAIEHKIVEKVLGDTTIHREIVSRSTVLMKFLAMMCTRDPENGGDEASTSNRHCLQTSHLLFAWKTCMRKADAVVSRQVYQLLVTILPLCPSSRSIPLLRAIQTSLKESSEERDYLVEVSDFVSELAAVNLSSETLKGDTPSPSLAEDVREEVLNLLFSVLIHPNVSLLQMYESLKRYMSHELTVEPKGEEHRGKFLRICMVDVERSTAERGQTDEIHALRMVKLTKFILETCPHAQAVGFASGNNAAMPRTMFNELISYLQRNSASRPIEGLKERLRILRYVYGLCVVVNEQPTNTMSFKMLRTLWNICASSIEEREHLMHFIAVASQEGRPGNYEHLQSTSSPASNTRTDPPLSPAFDSSVRNEAFRDLFCALDFDYDELGEHGYRSFHFLFRGIRDADEAPRDKRISLDALWKICLHAGNAEVASQAMKDLLAVYSTSQFAQQRAEDATDMLTDENEQGFGERMFQCLDRVKIDLEAKTSAASTRSVERCMRILNAAISGFECKGVATTPTLYRLSLLSPTEVSLEQFQALLPHGLRGQACYRRIGVMVNKSQHQSVPAYNAQSSSGGVQKFVINVHPLETLHSLKAKVSQYCRCLTNTLRLVQIHGRVKGPPSDPTLVSLSIAPEEAVMDELGIVQGCEVVFDINDRSIQTAMPVSGLNRRPNSMILSEAFFADDGRFANRLFATVLSIVEVIPIAATGSNNVATNEVYDLIWDLLLSMPTNQDMAKKISSAQTMVPTGNKRVNQSDAMDIDLPAEKWSDLLIPSIFDRSVYVLLTIDAMLLPAVESLSIFSNEKRSALEESLKDSALQFRLTFIESGGFKAVSDFFSNLRHRDVTMKNSRGNAVAMRILKACLLGDVSGVQQSVLAPHKLTPDDVGYSLLESLTDNVELLSSLVSMVVNDDGIRTSTVADVLGFVRILFLQETNAMVFAGLKGIDRFFVKLLMWDESTETVKSSAISTSCHVRRSTEDLIIHAPCLSDRALSWLIGAVESIELNCESTEEFFNVLEKLVLDRNVSGHSSVDKELLTLSVIVANKLTRFDPPGNENDLEESNTGVLSGCLQLLRALIVVGGSELIRKGSKTLVAKSGKRRWSEMNKATQKNVLSMVPTPFSSSTSEAEDGALIDLIGAIFDGFLCSSGQSAVAICSDKASRRRGFDVIEAGARFCAGSGGYKSLISRIGSLVVQSAPKLRHHWGQHGSHGEFRGRSRLSKYSGLRNQGCTCYMNSFLQQLFMMIDLRGSLCSSQLPETLRLNGSGCKGIELVGCKISLQWENGASYEAKVEAFNESNGMHTIRYYPIPVTNSQHVPATEIEKLPPLLPDEFIISEGRIGKETGTFEIVTNQNTDQMDTDENKAGKNEREKAINESADEADSRRLLEEVQRTFIHLQEGSRGHCFDPRSLVEACACLKLEFDVWQQNDASEFATKLLDRLEISLKKWAPASFRHLDHTFGLKQTKQKVCKKCGMKTSREEKFLSLDCQIRGKKDIHEALSAMTEVEIMEGSNQVHCENCMENTDTILRTAISTFPNMLILSLKRFDLDFNTFETVKLNSRCAFGQTLNMKEYSLAALDKREEKKVDEDGLESMVTDEGSSFGDKGLDDLPDDDFQYRLVGVLVHAGVAQGGHYYSFIKDREKGEDSWYRFDDEDVTPFDPKNIETECFGGKVKKDVKYANGLVQTEEQEQIANALMLFYEKVQPSVAPPPSDKEREKRESPSATLSTVSGYQAFEPDVRLANATHQLQSFLFDSEFQKFLKGVLLVCAPLTDEEADGKDPTWREDFINMLLMYVYDVLVYSNDWTGRSQEWAAPLENILLKDLDVALAFVRELARKTHQISGDWIRSTLLDCPDASIRNFSLRIISAGFKSTLSSPEEMKLLHGWVRSWRDQMSQFRKAAQEDKRIPVPSKLEGKFRYPEATEHVSFSSVGAILSHLNALVDALPRCWRFSPDLIMLIHNLTNMASDRQGHPFRRAFVDSQMPIRLVGYVVRERPPSSLKMACPGACISNEVAITQIKPESNPPLNAMPMGGSSMMNTHDFNAQNPRVASTSDCMILLETLAAFLGLDQAVRAPLLEKVEEPNHNRHWYRLNDTATVALETIFRELKSQGSQVMKQHEVENYLHCGGVVDLSGFSQQRSIEVLSKYGSRDKDGSPALTLDGFKAFHSDIVQSGDTSLRRALHMYGYRPNLTRRSRESRRFRSGERDVMRPIAQSITRDVVETLKDRKLEPGPELTLSLLNADHLYFIACELSEPLMSYLLAGFIHNRPVEILIDRILTELYHGRKDWDGNKYIANGSLMLQIIACAPGPDQQKRIARIMNSNVKPIRSLDQSGGILMVLRTCTAAVRHNQLYGGNDYHWMFRRYIDIIKELRSIYPIVQWMNDNRNAWSFIERDLDSRGTMRADYRGHDPLDANVTNSDSDMHGGNDSEEEDDDSHYDAVGSIPTQPRERQNTPPYVYVLGAGRAEVNGKYKHIGAFENYAQYTKSGAWGTATEKFSIFLCHVSNNTKHWYISIIPTNANPGTSADIDFYTAPMGDHAQYLPPPSGWVKAAKGQEPAPRLSFRADSDVTSSQDTSVEHDEHITPSNP